ncbi:MAG: metal-dependent hydrolase [Chitinophagaceae bacterium]
MQFTYYGQSGFLVVIGGKKVLFDPFISGNSLAQDIDVSTIYPDFILLSHGHGDHIADVATIAKQSGALVITNPEIHAYLVKQGVDNVHELNHGASVPFAFGAVRAVNAIHSSGLPDGSYGGNPMGFVITSEEKNFYFAGDTALTLDMQLVPLFGKMDFAVFPIGGNYTMDYNDAVIAADFAKVDKVVGVHYNTFPAITIDADKAVAFFGSKGKELLLPAVGETIEL